MNTMMSPGLIFELLTSVLLLTFGLLLNHWGIDGWGLMAVSLTTLSTSLAFRSRVFKGVASDAA